MCACVRACVRPSVRASVRGCVCVYACVYSFVYACVFIETKVPLLCRSHRSDEMKEGSDIHSLMSTR